MSLYYVRHHSLIALFIIISRNILTFYVIIYTLRINSNSPFYATDNVSMPFFNLFKLKLATNSLSLSHTLSFGKATSGVDGVECIGSICLCSCNFGGNKPKYCNRTPQRWRVLSCCHIIHTLKQ